MKMKKLLLILLLLSQSLFAREVSVMSYNVENLFDVTHDENKDDWEFLPKNVVGKNDFCAKANSRRQREICLNSDWTETKLKNKIENIVSVVKGKEANLPDILGLVEVENKNVISMLAKELGYKDFEMTESPDKRGVDVALLYKESESFKKVSRAEHVVPIDYPTRNILEVRFNVNGKYFLTAFVNHWPSLQNPDATRVKAAEVLKTRVEEILKANPNESIIAMGDFNTIDSNDPHPFKTVIYKNELLNDVHDSSLKSTETTEAFKKNTRSGTYYYPKGDQWNILDHFFVNQNLLKNSEAKILLGSYEIYSRPDMIHELKRYGDGDKDKDVKVVLAPKKFRPEEETKDKIGFSDHFPIYVKLDFKDVEVKVEKAAEKKVSKKQKKK